MAPKALLKKPAAAHVAAVDNVLTEENVTELIQGKSLDEKLVLYREWANTQIEDGMCNLKKLESMLKKMMDEKSMSTLWMRLKQVMKKDASENTKQAWNQLCEKGMREGKREKKNVVLCAQVAFGNPGDNSWEEYLKEEFKTIARIDSKASTSEWVYKGQLETKHGKEETEDMIRKGKFETMTDRWGDLMYRRKRVITTTAVETRNEARVTKKAKIDANQYATAEAAIQEYGNNGAGSTDHPNPGAAELQGLADGVQPADGDEQVELEDEKPKEEDDEEEPPKPEEEKLPSIEQMIKLLHDKVGAAMKCSEHLKGKTLAKSIRNNLEGVKNKMEDLRMDFLKISTQRNPDERGIKKKIKEGQKLVAKSKELLMLAKPHLIKK